MTIYIENIVKGFSRYHKYTLGTDLRNLSREVVRLIINRLLKKTLFVITRSDFCDEVISNTLIYIEARLLRFARNDQKMSFSTPCYRNYLKCRRNKRNTINALRFEINAEENLFKLSEELENKTYKPARSVCFVVERPKMREIIAADFRDRVVHHLLIERLEAIYEPIFIYDSYACRKDKGLHKAVERVREFIRRGSENGRKRLYFIHLDIRNFFMSIDRNILYKMLEKRFALVQKCHSPENGNLEKELPLLNKGGKEMVKKLFMFMITMVLATGVAFAAPADLPETGQTICYDAAGNVIACAGIGQDGDIKAGVAWPSPRFTVDGTGLCVTDNLTGLMWVKTPDSTARSWQDALTYANGLTLCGYTDWRLPNVNELESLINAGQANTATWLNVQGFSNVQAHNYWSSTTYANNTAIARYVSMYDGYVTADAKTSTFYVWPVRAGQ